MVDVVAGESSVDGGEVYVCREKSWNIQRCFTCLGFGSLPINFINRYKICEGLRPMPLPEDIEPLSCYISSEHHHSLERYRPTYVCLRPQPLW